MGTEDLIKSTVEELKKLLAAGNLMGQPVELEDKIIIPFSKIGFGFGSGSGEGTGKKSEGTGAGSGAGGGGGLSPVAAIVVFKGIPGPEGVKVIQLEGSSGIGKAIGEIASTCGSIMKEKKNGD